MTARHVAPALVLVLALPGGLAFAQRAHHGGGSGGGRGGGGAVPRSSSPGGHYSSPGMRSGTSHGSYSHASPVYRGGGSVAPYRHPRAGTGSGSYYYNGGYRGHYGGYYGGYYRPYYPYYGGYYRPYFYGSLYFGWPYYSWPYYSAGPYYSGGYYAGGDYTTSYTYAPSYYSGESAPDPYEERDAPPAPAPRAPYDDRSSVARGDTGQVRLEVRPEDASVYVDDQFRGTAREARILNLAPGRHTIELVRPGFAIEHRVVEVVKGERSDVLVELQRR